MSFSTLMLVLKSFFPFLKEIVLKDKDLRELVLENKLATFLAGALAIIFALFMHMTSIANDAIAKLDPLTKEVARLTDENSKLDERNGSLHDFLKSLGAVDENGNLRQPPTPNTAIAAPSLPPVPPTPVVPDPPKAIPPPSRKVINDKVEGTLKTYVEGRLQKVL